LLSLILREEQYAIEKGRIVIFGAGTGNLISQLTLRCFVVLKFMLM
jgi:hypothetical protein